jgi:hypothetical protein
VVGRLVSMSSAWTKHHPVRLRCIPDLCRREITNAAELAEEVAAFLATFNEVASSRDLRAAHTAVSAPRRSTPISAAGSPATLTRYTASSIDPQVSQNTRETPGVRVVLVPADQAGDATVARIRPGENDSTAQGGAIVLRATPSSAQTAMMETTVATIAPAASHCQPSQRRRQRGSRTDPQQ